MNFSVETINRLLASGRGYAQYVAGAATMFGLLSAADNKAILDAITQIYTGMTQVVHGGEALWIVLGPIASVALARWSSSSAKTVNQATQVAAAVKDPNTPVTIEAKAAVLDATANLPEVKKDKPIEVTDSKLAHLVPAANVVPSAQ